MNAYGKGHTSKLFRKETISGNSAVVFIVGVDNNVGIFV